jgi:hypothetical protein
MNYRIRTTIAAAWTIVAATLNLGAQTAPVVYQGRLDEDSSPANGLYDFRFSVLDAASGGRALFGPHEVEDLQVSGGLFTAEIPMETWMFEGSPRWMQIEVRTNGPAAFVTLEPPVEIASTPYAIHAGNAAGVSAGAITTQMLDDGAVSEAKLAGGSVTSGKLAGNAVTISKLGSDVGVWDVSSGDVYRSDGHVGIGTSNPLTLLHLEDAAPVITVNAANQSSGLRINAIGLDADQDQVFRAQADGTTLLSVQKGAQVGIGTESPTEKLHVDGRSLGPFGGNTTTLVKHTTLDVGGGSAMARLNLQASRQPAFGLPNTTTAGISVFNSSTQNQFVLDASGDSMPMIFRTEGIPRMIMSPEGNLVIGTTTSPTGRLHVAGGDAVIDGNVELRNWLGDPRITLTGDTGSTNPHGSIDVHGPSGGSLFGSLRGYDWGGVLLTYNNSGDLAATMGTGSDGSGLAYLNRRDGSLGVVVKGEDASGNAMIELHNAAGSRIKLDAGTGRITTPVLEVTGADVAEKFPVSEEVEPGMVLAIDPEHPGKLCLARGAYDRRVAGIVSGANDLPVGAILGNLPGCEDAPPIALSGRVWTHCDASNGAIEPGDLLTTSAMPGHASKVTDHDRAQGAVVGKAMSSLDEGRGLVLVLVNLQ